MLVQFYKIFETPSSNLEYKIFRYIAFIGTVVGYTLSLSELIIRQDYLSSGVSFVFSVVFTIVFFKSSNEQYIKKLKRPMVVLLILAANISWITSNGSGSTNMLIFATSAAGVLTLLNERERLYFNLFYLFNLSAITIFECFAYENLFRKHFFNNPNDVISSNLGVIITSLSLNFIISYLKKRFEQEYELNSQQIKTLGQKNIEIADQNLLLNQLNDQIYSQKNQIEENNQRLFHQSLELKDALRELAVLNNQLELKVKQRTSEIEMLNKELDLLFYRSSHDIRGPIMTLRGLFNLGILSEKDPQNLWLWDKANKTVDKLEHVITKFVMISEINHYEFVEDTIKIDHHISELLQKYHLFLTDVDFQLNISLNQYSFFDPRNKLIIILLENLLENSLHFQRKIIKTQIVIKIFEENNCLVLNVYDNGWGIQQELIPMVTNMYFRGNENSKGNGLGLYVVNTLLKKLDGKIEISSQFGSYCNVRVEIPI